MDSCGIVFFKQKTAYEFLTGLVGSEMWIRVSCGAIHIQEVKLELAHLRHTLGDVVEELLPLRRHVLVFVGAALPHQTKKLGQAFFNLSRFRNAVPFPFRLGVLSAYLVSEFVALFLVEESKIPGPGARKVDTRGNILLFNLNRVSLFTGPIR